jgi:hypothetical protein
MVGGSSAILDPVFTSAFVKFGMLSAEGQCRSFDATGHGYVRSDGVVVRSFPCCAGRGTCYVNVDRVRVNVVVDPGHLKSECLSAWK